MERERITSRTTIEKSAGNKDERFIDGAIALSQQPQQPHEAIRQSS